MMTSRIFIEKGECMYNGSDRRSRKTPFMVSTIVIPFMVSINQSMIRNDDECFSCIQGVPF